MLNTSYPSTQQLLSIINQQNHSIEHILSACLPLCSHLDQQLQHNNINHLSLLHKINNTNIFKGALMYACEQAVNNNNSTLVQSITNFMVQCLQNSTKEQGVYQKLKIIAQVALQVRFSCIPRLIHSCRSAQTALVLLLSLNDSLCQQMAKTKVKGLDLTHSTLFSLQIIKQSPNNTSINRHLLVEQALRHLLIINIIQNNQILTLVVSDHNLISSIVALGQQQPLTGYWHYFLGLLIRTNIHQSYASREQIQELIAKQFLSLLGRADIHCDLSMEIDKINICDKSQLQKRFILHQVRGSGEFICEYIDRSIAQGMQLETQELTLLMQYMTLRDFQLFGKCIKVISQIIHKVQISPQLIQAIMYNCLPLATPYSSPYPLDSLSFLNHKMQDKQHTYVSEQSSQAMSAVLNKILQKEGVLLVGRICDSFQQHIHSTIQKQYDHQFEHHAFMSCCHLMNRQTKRVKQLLRMTEVQHKQQNNMHTHTQDGAKLKQYIISNTKWLLNLNESCPAENRRSINLRILELMVTHPLILNDNHFLREVLQDQLVSKMPYSLNCLAQLQEDTQTQDNTRLRNKIVKQIHKQNMSLRDKMEVWKIVYGLAIVDSAFLNQITEMGLDVDNKLAMYVQGRKSNSEMVENNSEMVENNSEMVENKLQGEIRQLRNSIQRFPTFFQEQKYYLQSLNQMI